MKERALFTDVSVNSKLRIGFGAYVLIGAHELNIISDDFIKTEIRLKKFNSASSTNLEFTTLLWALDDIEKNKRTCNLLYNLTIYTDSQCIAGLQQRRARLEPTNYKSRRTNKELHNASLYRRFYCLIDEFNFQVVKLSGHTKSSSKNNIQRIFSYVDKATRKALRNAAV